MPGLINYQDDLQEFVACAANDEEEGKGSWGEAHADDHRVRPPCED